MNIHLKILAFSIAIFFTSGCENLSDVELEIENKEYIVVQAELQNDLIFKGVSFTKTLSLNETYDLKKAELKTVKAYLKINGVQVIPLHYTENGIYKPLYDLRILSGNYYELFAEANDKLIYSITTVPQKPEIIDIVDQDSFIVANVLSQVNEAYGSKWVVGNNFEAKSFYAVTPSEANAFNSPLPIRTQDIPNDYRGFSSTFIKVFSFDKIYAEYFKTKDNNKPIENTFTQGGGFVKWNVIGEDVIGLFVGIAEGDLIEVN